MASFALITEGITDQVAISSILIGLYEEEPEIRELQPLRDATDEAKQGNHAGWEKVLEYCSQAEFSTIFSTNDYAIIQIDTDVCDHVNFPVKRVDQNGERTETQLIDDVRDFILSKISPNVIKCYKDRIFLAICVHSLECWILPLHSALPIKSKKIKSCEDHLIRALAKKDLKYEKSYRKYLDLTKPFLKKDGINLAKKHCLSFQLFVESLPKDE